MDFFEVLLLFYASSAAANRRLAKYYARLFATDVPGYTAYLQRYKDMFSIWPLICCPLERMYYARTIVLVLCKEKEQGTLQKHLQTVANIYYPALLAYIRQADAVRLEDIMVRYQDKVFSSTDEQTLIMALAVILGHYHGKPVEESGLFSLFRKMVEVSVNKQKKAADTWKLTPAQKERYTSLRNRVGFSVLRACNYVDLIRALDPSSVEEKRLLDDGVAGEVTLQEVAAMLAEYWAVDLTAFLDNELIRREWIETVLKHMALCPQLADLPDGLLRALFLIYLQVFLLAKAVDDQREQFSRLGREAIEYEQQAVLKELEDLRLENSRLLQEKERLERELAENSREKELLEEIASLQRQVRELQQKLEREREKERELQGLREFVFSLQEEGEEEPEEKLPSIPPVKCVVVGGTEKWQRELKKHLPDTFSFIGADAKNFDPAVLRGVACIFVRPQYLSHSVYYRVMENADRDSRIVFLPGQNITKTLQVIGKTLKVQVNKHE